MKYGVQVTVSGAPVWVAAGQSQALASRSKSDRERLLKAALIRVLSKFGMEVTGVMEIEDEHGKPTAARPDQVDADHGVSDQRL